MIGRLKELLSANRLVSDFGVLSLGRLFASGIGFLIGVVIARGLGPESFGNYSIVIVIFEISVVFTELGLGTAIPKFIPRHLIQDKNKADYYLMISFWIVLLTSSSVFLLGYFLAPFIAHGVYAKPELLTPVRLGFLAVIGGSLWGYFLSNIQGRERFKVYAAFSVIINLIKITVIYGLYALGLLSLANLLLVQFAAPLLGFLLGNRSVPTRFLGVKGELKPALKELFEFSKWILLIDVAVMLFSRLDILMLGYFSDERTVGYYSAAFTLIYVFTILTSSLGNVLLPMVSKLSQAHEFKTYMKRIIPISLSLCLLLSPMFYFIDPIVHFVFGEVYASSILIFRIMFFGILFNLLVEPVYLVAYADGKPNIISRVALLKLFFNFISNLVLIPPFGAVGAAVATIITNVAGGLIALHFIHREILNKPAAN
ncbi:MAG: flippase [bacterium]